MLVDEVSAILDAREWYSVLVKTVRVKTSSFTLFSRTVKRKTLGTVLQFCTDLVTVKTFRFHLYSRSGGDSSFPYP
jgi:hypothetical protein